MALILFNNPSTLQFVSVIGVHFHDVTLLPEPYHCIVYLEYLANSPIEDMLGYTTCLPSISTIGQNISISVNRSTYKQSDYGEFIEIGTVPSDAFAVGAMLDLAFINASLLAESNYSISLVMYGFAERAFSQDSLFLSIPIQLSIGTVPPVPLVSAPIADVCNQTATALVLHWMIDKGDCGSRTTYFVINLYAWYEILRSENTTFYDCIANQVTSYSYVFGNLESEVPYFATVQVGNALGISEESHRSNIVTLKLFKQNWRLIGGIAGGLGFIIGIALLVLLRYWRRTKHALNRLEIWHRFWRSAGSNNVQSVTPPAPTGTSPTKTDDDASYVSFGGTPYENSPTVSRKNYS